ncbi:DUF885 domain-containing protein [Pendulispora albinea]|uniref:DUF885 domain-containing protein n=1 Tax=Pendulispora albinea TaxID=2741071 RepID=A0ABZ2M6E4_9BACT
MRTRKTRKESAPGPRFGIFVNPVMLAALVPIAGAAACGSREPPPPDVPPPTMALTSGGEHEAHTAMHEESKVGTPEDQAFQRLGERFLARYLELLPVDATRLGEHRHDGRWPDLSEAGEAVTRQFIAQTRAELDKIRREGLGVQNRIDAAILQNQLDYWQFGLDELREAVLNPTLYTTALGEGIDPLVSREFAPIEERMQSLRNRLRGVPTLVAAAKKRLGHPARVQTETAIAQNKGLIALCKAGFPEQLGKVSPGLRREVEAAAKRAAASLEDLQTFLEHEVLPRSDGDLRLGRAKFEKKLRFVLDDEVDIDAIAKGARALLTETQEQMYATARELWPTLYGIRAAFDPKSPAERRQVVKKVLDQLSAEHSTNATIIPEAQQLLEQATAFVREKNLVGLSDEPCRIIEMPEYRRGVSIAYCDSSGPLEKKQETFYAIAPTPSDWPKKRVDSFYREYNRSMLADLTIHEAMPGHYLEAMHTNRFKSNVRAVFANGAFVEGWAVYAEWFMAQHGFGGPKVRLQRQKMVLRLACNAILDHGIHAGTMDEKAALALMMNDGFQEEGEAVAKWQRARLTSAQLTTYYYGFTEMMKLRAIAEKQPGFTERTYHDRLLSFGEPSFRHLRGLIAAPPAPAPTSAPAGSAPAGSAAAPAPAR